MNNIDMNQVMQMLQQPQQAPQPQPQKQDGFRITGTIVQFENSDCKIGDVNLRSVPNDVQFKIERTSDGHEYLRSVNEYSAIAHVGEHGKVWGDNVTDTGSVATFKGTGSSSFRDRLAKLRGESAPKSETDDGQSL